MSVSPFKARGTQDGERPVALRDRATGPSSWLPLARAHEYSATANTISPPTSATP